MRCSVWIGFDPREATAYAVARHSLQRRLILPIPVRGLIMSELRDSGLYYRDTVTKDGKLWDVISEASMSTEFAISRFLVPHIAKTGWALFLDCDMLIRTNVEQLFAQCDPDKAVMCVKHHYEPPAGMKMDGQEQTRYARKNWSSLMVLNCDHSANKALTVEYVNSVPGRDLHRFAWLEDDMIGEIDASWNYLVGHTDKSVDPNIIHFTEGGPWFPAYENTEYANEWRQELNRWAL